MVDLNTEICVCNSVAFEELAQCIKENDLNTLEELLQNSVCPVGDKCESCIDEGFHNDGINLPFVLSQVKKGLV